MIDVIKRFGGWCVLVTALHAGAAFAAPESVNVNQADAQTIAEVLKGVGLSRAQAIVEYREQNGDFRDAYELANIKGIGERTVEQNEAKIRLQD
ncbi:MAG: ComEA family DNA-binding protein [Gammaproteobacteria bacterium]|nr:ComEA family DNA-binding protein [Gammaproteobacteria bacterium]